MIELNQQQGNLKRLMASEKILLKRSLSNQLGDQSVSENEFMDVNWTQDMEKQNVLSLVKGGQNTSGKKISRLGTEE